MPYLVSLSADYRSLGPAVDRMIAAMRKMLEDCHRSKRETDDGDIGPRAPRRPGRGGGRAGADLLGQILGWNPSSQGGLPNSWGGPSGSSGGDD